MSGNLAVGLMLVLVIPSVFAGEDAYVSDPADPELKALAQPLVVDESKYGCGPLLKPGKTYYVSLHGDDKNDGPSWAAAWRHLGHATSRLQAGDTRLIGEGEYHEECSTART